MSRSTILKALAPLTSGALLAYLIARVSSCDPPRDTVPPPVAKRPPQEAPLQASSPSALPDAGGLGRLGGSKSGIIGILNAQQAAADAMQDASSEQQAPAREPERTKLLGGTKSGRDVYLDVEELAK